MTLAFLLPCAMFRMQPWAGIKASDASINQTTSDGFRFGLHKQMIIASLSVGMQQTEQSCQLLCTFYLHFLVTRPATRTSHTCANYRNNVCLPLNLCVFECLCVCVWGRGEKPVATTIPAMTMTITICSYMCFSPFPEQVSILGWLTH